MANLYNVESPINREQRNNLNATFEDILRRFGHLQRQINILSGGQEVDEILTRLEQAIANAETGIQDYINQVDNTVQQAIDANNTATQDAISVNSTALQTALQTVSDTLGQLNTAISNAETATQDATTAKNNAIQATSDARNAINNMQSLINNFGSRGQFMAGTQYYKNNIVSDGNGNSYIALVDNINVGLADTSKWMLFAKKGEKGDRGEKGDTGAALSILGRLNDASELPTTGQEGQAYTINGELYVWSENTSSWENVGNIKGEKGDTGDTGDDGKSAYQIALANGFIGSEADWLASLKGEKGDTPDLTNIEQSIEEIDDQLATHLDEIATTTKLGHIKPDGTTIIVNPTTGVASAIGGGSGSQSETTGAMNLYVNSTSGLDTNDGSQANPFKTIQHAIDSLPDLINHTVLIRAVDGTYNEDVILHNLKGKGTIGIYTASDAVDRVFVNLVSIYNCSCNVSISKINQIAGSTASPFISVNNSVNITLNTCKTTTSGAYGIALYACQFINAFNNTVSNKSTTAFLATNATSGIFQGNIGTSNMIGFSVQNTSRIYMTLNTLTATTLQSTSGGGQILT